METATMLMITMIVLCPGILLCKYQEDMASILYHLAQGKEAFLNYVKDSIFSHVRPQLGLPNDIWPCNLVERVAWGTPAPQWRYTSLGVIYDAQEFPNPSDDSDDETFQVMAITLFHWSHIWSLFDGSELVSPHFCPHPRVVAGGVAPSLSVAEMMAAGVWPGLGKNPPISEVQKIVDVLSLTRTWTERLIRTLMSSGEYTQVWMQIKFTVAELRYVKWHLWFVMASLVLYQRWGSPCTVTSNRMSYLALVMPKKVNDWHGEKVPITKLVVTQAKHKKKTSGGSGGGSSSGAGPSSYYNQYDGGLPSIPDAVEEEPKFSLFSVDVCSLSSFDLDLVSLTLM
ncbi:hypothetical protein K439DRAFT_1661970 [Ramaria rubella]|nr:hypothetical protein K439DRAFT_1661970 [Ramaria rubella]